MPYSDRDTARVLLGSGLAVVVGAIVAVLCFRALLLPKR